MATLTKSYQLIANKQIGTISGSGVSAKTIYLRIYAKYTSQSIVDNKSYVSYKSTLYVTGEGTYFYTGSSTTKTLGGTGATSISADAQGNYNLGETTLCETTGTITHGSNGAASVSITAGWVSAPWGISGSLTGTADLPTIHRATTPTLSATTITMGNAITVSLNPANSTFKHKLRYDFGSVKGSADGFSIGANFTAQGNASVTFTPPTSLGSQIPNNMSGTGQIVCYTYTSSGTHIGTTYVNITLNVPSYTPEINNVTLTGNYLRNGVYVQGKSTVTVNATEKTYYGAKTQSIVVETDAKQYTTLPCTSSVLSSGSRIVKITFTDTRNKSVTYTSSAFTVYPYSVPTISAFNLKRDENDPTTVIASISGSISPLGGENTKSFSITLSGPNYNQTNNLTLGNGVYNINGSTTFTGVSTDSTLTATAKIEDYYYKGDKAITQNATLPTVAVTMDFHHSGTGVAFGKVAEHSGYLDVNWNAQFRKYLVATSTMFAPMIVERDGSDKEAAIRFENSSGVLGYIGMMGDINGGLRRWTSNSGTSYLVLDAGNTKDFIVDQGTNGIWTYRKYNSGICECWGNVSTTPTTVNGNNAVSVDLPFTFVGTDYKVNISPAKAAMYITSFGDCATNGNITHTTTSFTMAYKYSYGTAYTVSFNVNVYGKWK